MINIYYTILIFLQRLISIIWFKLFPPTSPNKSKSQQVFKIFLPISIP